MTEHDAMVRALELAAQGWGRVAPNPLVGAVLLREGRIVGEGFHAEFGQAHAEQVALTACDEPNGTTCVVTLEPCAHQGKTPPCTTALIEAGVKRVVMAMRDPTESAAGGLELLRSAGIEAVVGICEPQASALNAAFLFNVSNAVRPFVALKLATSLDGFLADQDSHSKWISGVEARDYVHWLRAGFDAVGVGRRTAELDDPLLTVRGAVQPRIPPTRVIFAREGPLDPGLKLFDTAAAPTVVVVATGHAVDTREMLLHTVVEVVEADEIGAALLALRQLGIESILAEGGGALASALFEADLVDRFYWIQAPLWLGRGTPGFARKDAAGAALGEIDRWLVTERRPLGVDTLLVVDRRLCLQE